MKKGEKQALGAIVAIVLIGFLAAQGGFLKQWGIAPPLNYQAPPEDLHPNNSTTDYSNGVGKYALDFKAANTATSAALSVATDINIWAMHYVNGQYTPEGAMFVTSSACYFTATPADNGYMWILVKPFTTTFYVDYQAVLSKEGLPGYIVGVQYIQDPLGDGHKDFLFQFNLKNQPVPAAGSYPVLGFTAWGMAYDASLTGFTGIGNQSSIGTVSVPKYYELDFAMSAASKGIAVYKIEVLFGNSSKAVTDQTKATITSVIFPGQGTISGDSFSQSFETNDIRYSCTLSTSLYGADYILLGPTANNKFPVTLQLQFTLITADEIPVTINVYYFNVAGVGQSFSTTFYANA